jgi:hypothetical protein
VAKLEINVIETIVKCGVLTVALISVFLIFHIGKKRNKEKKPLTEKRLWQGITLDDIDKQWEISKSVHPSFGRQLGHFSSGLECLLKLRNNN